MSELKVDAITDASGGDTATINGMTPTADSLQGFRNRIINGAMMIDQRNAGASVSGNNNYTLDRWQALVSASGKFTVQQNAGSVTPPTGFTNYLGVTSSSAYSVGSADYFTINQRIEGFNIADLGWGAAGAQSVTFSFWVRSSLTGTFGGSLRNSASNRSYPFTYTISSANTWEQKTVTIAGDTSGTWLTTNGIGIDINFSLGAGSAFNGTAGAWNGNNNFSATGATSVVGTNGATFYITGVQLEAGSVATPFERRPYGTELALCQRYAYMMTSAGSGGNYLRFGFGETVSTSQIQLNIFFPVQMRSYPSLTTTGTASNYAGYSKTNLTALSAIPLVGDAISANVATVVGNVAGTPFTAGYCGALIANNTQTVYLLFTAEL